MARTVTAKQPANPPTNTVAGRMAYVWRFLTGNLHLSAAQAAGVEGNWTVEDPTFDPARPNPAEGAIGLAQWEGDRRTALQAFAASRGTSETDLLTQLLFFAKEAGQRGNLAALRKTTNPTAAAYVIQHDFEVSNPSSLPTREANARAVFASATKYGSPHPLAGVPTGGLDGITAGSGATGGQGIVWGPFGPVPDAAGGIVKAIAAVAIKLTFSAGAAALIVLGVKQAGRGAGS